MAPDLPFVQMDRLSLKKKVPTELGYSVSVFFCYIHISRQRRWGGRVAQCFIITLPLSRYVLNYFERDRKHQIIIT